MISRFFLSFRCLIALCLGLVSVPAHSQNRAAPPALPSLSQTSPSQTSPSQTSPSQASPWRLDYTAARGVSVSYRGVPIIRRSSLYVVKPGWSGLIFDARAQEIEVEKREGGTLHVTTQNADFAARYELIPRGQTEFELRFRGELKRDMSAEIEFAAGYFNANLIANRRFEARKSGALAPFASGLVPAFPVAEELMGNDLAPEFQSLEFDSRIGKIRLETDSKSRVAFADARRESQNWAKEAPIFWCGWMAGAQPLKFGAPVEMTLKIRVEAPLSEAPLSEAPLSDGQSRSGAAIKPALRAVSDAVSTRDKPLLVVPRPQSMVLKTGAPFLLGNGTKISVLAPRGETRLLAALHRVLRDEWAIQPNAPVQTPSDASGWCRLVLGAKSGKSAAPARRGAWAGHRDAYRIIADARGIAIDAPTARGAFYGIQTLSQLLRPAGNGAKKGASVAPLQIEDFATLRFRGAHWFPSRSGVPFHQKLIKVMARAKMNVAVIQCEAARWDSHPEIAHPNSVSKADLRQLVALCRANFIEPIPLINTPGHAEWMFRGGHNLDLAEDPQTPYAYAVNNPNSAKFIREIFSEAIEVFRPRTFHIGHDEVTLRGRFPNPQSRFYRQRQSATDLVMENLISLHAWLDKQGIGTMVWSDMFLHPDEGPGAQKVDAASAPSVEEAQKRRRMLPKDVIIADWHYGSNREYPSLELFKKDGLQTVAATWNTPQNIRNFSRAAQESGAQGVLQTTWAGYFPDAQTLDTALSQFTAFILAGDYAWSNRDTAPSELPYDAVAQLSAAYAPQKAGQSGGTLLDLAPAATATPENWLGLGAGRDLSALFEAPNAARRFDDVKFQIPARRLVVLSAAPSELAPSGSVQKLSLKIDARAAQIALLHGTLWSVPDGTLAAQMRVEYQDGTSANFDLKVGQTVASSQSEAVALNARRGWQAKSPDGSPLGLRVTRWPNPHPEKTIARLVLTPVDAEAGYVLAGATLIEK